MSKESENNNGPDPETTLRQAAGLAEHLGRIGAEWLPTPNAESVATLAEQFCSGNTDESTPNVTAPGRTAPGRTAPGRTAPDTAATVARAAQPTAQPTEQPRHPGHPQDGAAFSLTAESSDTGQAYPGAPVSTEQRIAALAEYNKQVAACARCEILAKCRTNTVFGEGDANPRVVFIGEGPGRDEDLSGRPFVGKAGELLTKMIQACKFEREDVYIMNTVKCRPPNNRNPEPTEIENCREFFEAQLNLLRPEYIVCLGLVSAQALLRTKLSVGRMRGKFHQHFDSKVLVTYHPAYLLRTPAAKKAAWDDLQLMLRDAGLM